MAERRGVASGRRWVWGLLPLFLLAGLIGLFVRFDPTGPFRAAFPPLEELTIERVTFPEPGTMEVHLVNGGPEASTIAQLQVDVAYRLFEIDGSLTIPRLGRRTLTVAYPWLEGEPHQVTIVTSTGLTFTRVVEVATLTPRPNARYLGTFTLLGLYAGVVPVLLGLLWFPFLRRVDRRWLHFFLSLTLGLLIFLGVDALEEALETAERVPGAFQGVGLTLIGVSVAVLALRALGEAGDRAPTRAVSRLRIAYLIAVGIGLHNLGEGLAIGAAYSVGEIALGSFLVIGFALHNTTEGLAIVAPVAGDRPGLRKLAGMGATAGLPTIGGAWIGGFSYSPIAATLFLALGAGAIFQVVWVVGKLVHREWPQGIFEPLNAGGLALGLLLMYGTALLVVA
ncbi:MAG: ZIP family metal transporter [Gemmatimonadota bacterium]